MHKKAVAIAVAGALGAPAVALAQSSTVQVFGTMYIEYSFVDQGNNPAGLERSNADFIQTPGSEIGFKGEEKLGGGLSAWFQCTTTADPRGISQNGWCSRNSALGIKGAFGNVFFGNWDIPSKRTSGPLNVGANDTGIWGTAFLLTFPMPFGTSIRIAYFNIDAGQTATVYSMTTYALTSTDEAGGQRLRCQGVRYVDQKVTRTASSTTTLATITGGPGSIVYHSYVGGVGATNLSWLERNFSVTVDGEATPQIVATGTEDWFDSGWYFYGRRDYNTSFHSYVGTDRPAGNVNTVAMATDLWSKWGGLPFTTSAVVRSLPEAGCTTGDTLCWCILYYQ